MFQENPKLIDVFLSHSNGKTQLSTIFTATNGFKLLQIDNIFHSICIVPLHSLNYIYEREEALCFLNNIVN